MFDDSRSYRDPAIPYVGVQVPDAGVRMRVTKIDGTTLTVRITGR